MAPIHFSHANGFPARCYEPLFRRLDAEVSFVERMGHGDFPVNGDFEHLTAELIAAIESGHGEPVVGMGHSTGGVVTLLAAGRRPDLFRDLVILDPILFCGLKRWPIRLGARLGLRHELGPARGSRRRRTRFESLDAVRRRLERKPLFQAFDPECFESYLEHGFAPTDDGEGVELAFSREVETEIFASTQTEVPSELYGLEGLMVHGDRSSMLWDMDVRWWRRKFPGFEIREMPGGHLFPFEDPAGVAATVTAYLER